MICPNCNAEISDSMKFCENCGVALPASTTQQPNVAPQGESPYGQPSGEQQFGQQAEQPYGAQQPSEQVYDAQQPAGQPYGANQYGYQQPGQPYDAQQYGQQPGQSGAAPTPPGVYTTSYGAGPAVSSTPFVLAIIALVTSLLGLFPVSLVLAIVALVLNSGQKKRGEFSTKQTPTTVMSIISLVVSVFVLVAAIMLGGMFAAFVASEGTSASTSDRPSVSATASSSTKSSSASSASASSSASADGSESAGATAAPASSASEIMDRLVGSWKLTGLTSDGEVANAEDIELMQDVGLTVSLDIKEDGTVDLVLFGVNMSGIWESADGVNVSMRFRGDTMNATVNGTELTLVDGEDRLTFTKQ